MGEPLHVVCPHCDSVNRLPAERLAEGGRCGRCHQPLFTGHPVSLNQARFSAHLTGNDLLMLVDFWAPWCGPCRQMAPVFEQAAIQLEPQVRLVKVNTEEEPLLSQQFAVRSIPTLALFRQGQEVARQPGAVDLGRLVAWVRQYL
mgnify:CR=1 FL=1